MTTEEMNIDERFKYLRIMKERYRKADREGRSDLLDEMELVTGLHRKYLVSRMGGPGPLRRRRRQERGRAYGPDVDQAIAIVADTLDWICAERLKPTLRETAQQLAKFGEMEISQQTETQLADISISTLHRRLQTLRPESAQLPRMRRRPYRENAVQVQVPMRVIPWDEPEPGHFEVDLVHHGTPTEDGQLVYTVQFLDVLTGWSERFAILGCSFDTMWRTFQAFSKRSPMPVREAHSDNGSEFMNRALFTAFGDAFQGSLMSRGRPAHSNDNRFVEQKNDTLVRAYLGNLGLHTREQAAMLDKLYADMRVYYNLFQPVLRQIERIATIAPDGICRVTRKQDEAKTPLQRLLNAKPPISRKTASELTELYERTNPRALKRTIHAQLEQLYRAALADNLEEDGSR